MLLHVTMRVVLATVHTLIIEMNSQHRLRFDVTRRINIVETALLHACNKFMLRGIIDEGYGVFKHKILYPIEEPENALPDIDNTWTAIFCFFWMLSDNDKYAKDDYKRIFDSIADELKTYINTDEWRVVGLQLLVLHTRCNIFHSAFLSILELFKDARDFGV